MEDAAGLALARLDLAELDLVTPSGLRAALTAAGLRLRPSRGQHFLVNRHVLDRILSSAGIKPGEAVLEVGAGVGTLTVALARSGARVTAVEVDGRFMPVLRAVCSYYPNVRIVHGDAMALTPEMLPEAPDAVVANLPYAIASPLLINLLEAGLGRRFVVMVQHEVAGRIVAPPGGKSYGLLSVALQARAAAAIVARVPRSAFFPPPEVDSAIVRLEVREEPAVPRPLMPVLMAVARAAFGQRRKMLRSALQSVRGTRLPAAAVEDLCRAAGVDPRRRGESLSLSEFSLLARALADRE
ncbi:MAG: 16S rRNA (adenine(1518)-N(6)/adenine(1519)-N(6))-dimethyltransferase RsmA [bacterium]|nr:16S rRNA (adenine(1518)-N(6)/adenine(1519)-N(6))-dimethyltransferase RsmA [bacterium]